jgi:hypothetical protein
MYALAVGQLLFLYLLKLPVVDKELEFLKNELKEDYTAICRIPERGICGVARMAFTVGLFYGLDQTGYIGRYCFHTMSEAMEAIKTWDGKQDAPGNWIKHKGGIEYANPNYEKYG